MGDGGPEKHTDGWYVLGRGQLTGTKSSRNQAGDPRRDLLTRTSGSLIDGQARHRIALVLVVGFLWEKGAGMPALDHPFAGVDVDAQEAGDGQR